MKGRCNICNAIGQLTRDHVPPLGTVESALFDVQNLTEYLSCESSKPRRAHGSVEFINLCKVCNSERLGTYYDPHLKEFCNAAATWIRARYKLDLSLPAHTSIRIKPLRVARAIVGHLLAAEARSDRSAQLIHAPMPDAMRDFFLNENALPSPKLELFCWPYPSDWQVIIRAAGVAQYGRKGVVTSDFLKFFPVAFWVAWDRPVSVSVDHLASLTLSDCSALDDECTIKMPLSNVPPVDWPENPAENGMLYVSDRMTSVAQPVRRRGRKNQ